MEQQPWGSFVEDVTTREVLWSGHMAMQTMSSLFLGVLDAEVLDVDVNNAAAHRDNRLGGRPCLSDQCPQDLPLATCRSCGKQAAFIAQIYSPIDDTPVDRVIYFFACLRAECKQQDCVVFRVVTDVEKTKKKKKVTEKLFDDGWDDDDGGANDGDTSNPVEDAKLDRHGQVVGLEAYDHFRPHYIAVIEEPTTSAVNIDRDQYNHLIDNKTPQQAEVYEKSYSSTFASDVVNYKFYKTLRRCPEQLIRYEWRGQALASTGRVPAPKPSRCAHCGSARVFELQFMPALVATLNRIQSASSNISFEFETIQVYTCGQNCRKQSVNQEETFIFKENYQLEKVNNEKDDDGAKEDKDDEEPKECQH